MWLYFIKIHHVIKPNNDNIKLYIDEYKNISVCKLLTIYFRLNILNNTYYGSISHFLLKKNIALIITITWIFT